jgi:thioredoxin 1
MKKLLALVFALFALTAMPAKAQQIEFDIYDKSDFDKQLASNKPVIVHINTTWWPVCRRQVLALDELRKQPEYSKLNFMRINFDTETEFKKTYNVPVRSVIILFKGGKEVDRVTANGDKAAIEALVKKGVWLQKRSGTPGALFSLIQVSVRCTASFQIAYADVRVAASIAGRKRFCLFQRLAKVAGGP